MVPPMLSACASTGPTEAPSVPAENDAIIVCGQRFPTGTRVVLWNEPGGYDAYALQPRFPAELRGRPVLTGQRYGVRRDLPAEVAAAVTAHGFRLGDLRRQVDQFVIHYDVCGTSRQCFKILQDMRKLSVHFMLDTDGTIYQTLDLSERAWHASKANNRSIGIEIAQIGAYPLPAHPVLREWYGTDQEGPFVRFPKWMKKTGIRTPGFVARPARSKIVSGEIQGTELWQYDFTNEQYEALGKLAAALARAFPRLRLDYPKDAAGRLIPKVLSDAQFACYSGLLGHFHVQKNKTDPGPAFDWERVVRAARAHYADVESP